MLAATIISSLLFPTGVASSLTNHHLSREDHQNKHFFPKDQCTALAVGPKAMSDGSTIATHNNDCQECDIRITHVPARDWEPGSRRPIFDERTAYPRFLQTPENNVHGPSYLFGTEDSTIFPWKAQDPIFSIDQVSHTYAYTMGTYPLQNEKQLSMGESTCFSTMWSTPITLGGKSAFNVRSLMEIAMERCDSARCAIKLMGSLAEKYGFFCYEGEPSAHADCSEALTISDPHEAWIFHVNADDTHESAVWVAQRVPDDEIAAVANMFVISTIDLSQPDYYLASSNVYDVAIRSGLWSPTSGEEFSYLKVYGVNPGASADGCTRRVWRVFTLANPSLPLSPFTDGFTTYGYGEDGSKPYPFSVKPEQPLDLQDIFKILRDNYDGTDFDLTNGIDAGPFGDVIRSGPNSIRTDPVNGITAEDYKTTVFPNRPISLWRTAYASIAQSRASLPDSLGAVTWIAPNAPHHSTFIPVYASVETVPETLTNTTQYKFDRSKNYWTHSVVGNYLSRWYKWTLQDVQELQKQIEENIFTKQTKFEASALKSYSKNYHEEALSYLNEFQQSSGEYAVTSWWNFFWETVVSKYRDIYKVTRPHEENFLNAPDFMGYDRWWSEMVGYWGKPGQAAPGRQPMGVPPLVFETTTNQEEFHAKYPLDGKTKYFLHPSFTAEETTTPSAPIVAPVIIPPPAVEPTEPIVPPPPPSTPADVNADTPTDTPTETETSSGLLLKYGGSGYILGIVSTVLMMALWNMMNPNKVGYAPIPDINI